jgi:hypothetical protein
LIALLPVSSAREEMAFAREEMAFANGYACHDLPQEKCTCTQMQHNPSQDNAFGQQLRQALGSDARAIRWYRFRRAAPGVTGRFETRKPG